MSGDLDPSRAGQRRDAVADGVLDQRLQQQARHLGCQGFVVDGVVDRQAVAEPDALDVEIAFDQVDLFVQRHERLAAGVEGEAQQIAQTGEHGACRGGVLLDEGRDGVQRVEQEVGLQLPAQRRQLSLGQALLEASRDSRNA